MFWLLFYVTPFFYTKYELNETVRINGKNDDNFGSTFSYKVIFLTNQACVFLCSHFEHVVRIGETKHTSFKKGLSISTLVIINFFILFNLLHSTLEGERVR